ncbi:MAG: S8 family serine peptidase, partial [Candidatus Eisenbacteria bacterium]|nr:S8 family serine peptidase [Candidatus Eisenbacteria bacterium]
NWTDQGYDQSEEVGSPGTAFRAITVGSFNTKRCWDNGNPTQQCTSISESLSGEGLITWFSSHGPTRDGRQKPDLVAPGFVIAAAKSSGIAPELESLYGFPGTIDADGVHFYQAGTSMSAPHVTGAVALLLAVEPKLTPEDVRTRLIDSSTQDEFTGEGWSPDGGHGKLNVAALLNVTPLAPSGLRLSAESGVLEVAWEQTAPYQALAFRLERRAAGANLWERVGIFPGPGPHRHHQNDMSPASYRLYASMRTGDWELWGEASWSGVLEPVLAVGPNPFSDGLEFSHPLAQAEVLIFDLQGRVVRRFEGHPSVPQSWDGRDELGQPVPAGVYWIRVQSEDQQLTKRILRLP